MKKTLLVIALLLFAGIAIGATAISISNSEEDFIKEIFKTDKREVSEVIKEQDVYVIQNGKDSMELEVESYSITTRDSNDSRNPKTQKFYMINADSVKNAIQTKTETVK